MNTLAMRIRKSAGSILVLVVTLVASAVSARAQDTEVAAGVSWVWLQGDYGRWHTYQGWSIELARFVTPHLSIAGEAGGSYYPVDYTNGWSESHRIYTFTAGPRVNTSRNDRVTGFVQLLAGVERSSYTLRTPPAPDFNGSATGFVIQPGGGVDVKVARRAAARADLSAVVADPWHSISWQLPLWRFGLSGVYRW
jgi:hypothetical protein